METVVARFPEPLIQKMDRLVASGGFASRSEVVRAALRELLRREAVLRQGKRDSATFERRVRRLSRDPRWKGRWVALFGDEPIDSDTDHDALLQRILRMREDPIYMIFAGKDPPS